MLAPLVALAGGCATYLDAQVTAFHQTGVPGQPGAPAHRFAGQGFVIEPTAAQQESLEFRAYADLVRQALVREGLVEAPQGSAALAVTLRYSVDNGKPVVYGYPAYGYGAFGPAYAWAPYYYGRGGHVHYAMTATYPFGYGMVGPGYIGPGYYSQSLVYRRELRVDISDRRAGGNPAKLYEGSVVSEGESAALAPVMPAMVRALFNGFPGPNGVTRRVQVVLGDASAAAAN